MSENILDKFLRYVAVDTEADPESKSYPSTEKQRVLGYMLEDELKAIGLSNVDVDEHGYVTATLPSNTDKKVPTIFSWRTWIPVQTCPGRRLSHRL